MCPAGVAASVESMSTGGSVLRSAVVLGMVGVSLAGCGASQTPISKAAQCRSKPGVQHVRVTYAPDGSSVSLQSRVEKRLRSNKGIVFSGECPTIVTASGNVADVYLPPGSPDVAPLLSTSGELAFRPVLNTMQVNADTDLGAIEKTGPNGSSVLPGDDNIAYVLGPNEFAQDSIESAEVDVDPATAFTFVRVTLTDAGSIAFDALAAKNYQKQIAIVFDGKVLSAPMVNAHQFGGTVVISGNFSRPEAEAMAAGINGGALPALVKIEAAPKG
jgi:preprotein translocase subunit SecD